jgi:hypothetical protein
MTVHFTGPNSMQEQKSIYSMSCVVNKRQSGWYMLVVRCLARVLHGDQVSAGNVWKYPDALLS